MLSAWHQLKKTEVKQADDDYNFMLTDKKSSPFVISMHEIMTASVKSVQKQVSLCPADSAVHP